MIKFAVATPQRQVLFTLKGPTDWNDRFSAALQCSEEAEIKNQPLTHALSDKVTYWAVLNSFKYHWLSDEVTYWAVLTGKIQPLSYMIENSLNTSISPVAYSGYINGWKACSDPLKIRSYKWSAEGMKVEEDEEGERDEITLVNTYKGSFPKTQLIFRKCS